MADAGRQVPWRTHGKVADLPYGAATGTDLQFSVVVPAFNEENAAADTLDTIRAAIGNDAKYEVIVVNDGSTDTTATALAEYVDRNPDGILIVNHQKNRGYGAALKTGIRNASSDLIVITDADGTYPSERIPELVEAMADTRAAMVVGARVGEEVHYSKIRRIPKVFLKAYIDWIARTDVPDFNSGLRVFRRDVAEKFLGILPDGFSFTTTITLACITNNYPVHFTPISYARRVGKSKIQPIRDTLRFTQLIVRTGMYFAPVRILGPVTVFIGLLAMISLGSDIVNNNLTDSTVLLFLFTLNTGMIALLADMIDKRIPR